MSMAIRKRYIALVFHLNELHIMCTVPIYINKTLGCNVTYLKGKDLNSQGLICYMPTLRYPSVAGVPATFRVTVLCSCLYYTCPILSLIK